MHVRGSNLFPGDSEITLEDFLNLLNLSPEQRDNQHLLVDVFHEDLVLFDFLGELEHLGEVLEVLESFLEDLLFLGEALQSHHGPLVSDGVLVD